MNRISDSFMRVAVIAGLCGMGIGMGMGMLMGMTRDFSLAPAHAHMNLLGWVSMAIYALFYRLVPAATEGRLPAVHFLVAVVALATMIPGIALINLGKAIGEPLASIGGTAMILGFAIFAVIVFRATAPARA